jgi:hypothetical protein
MQYQTTSSGATIKARHTKYILPILLTYNSKFWSVFKGSQGNATFCDSLSITTEGIHLTTWWSLTKCHIQITMTEMTSHGCGMHSIVLIKFFHFVLKVIPFKKPSGVFDASVDSKIFCIICFRH